jgi:hypothetical protein
MLVAKLVDVVKSARNIQNCLSYIDLLCVTSNTKWLRSPGFLKLFYSFFYQTSHALSGFQHTKSKEPLHQSLPKLSNSFPHQSSFIMLRVIPIFSLKSSLFHAFTEFPCSSMVSSTSKCTLALPTS